MTTPRRLTLDDIEEDLLIAAELVDRYGEEMQPLLDRMEAEYNKMKMSSSATDRIRKMLGK